MSKSFTFCDFGKTQGAMLAMGQNPRFGRFPHVEILYIFEMEWNLQKIHDKQNQPLVNLAGNVLLCWQIGLSKPLIPRTAEDSRERPQRFFKGMNMRKSLLTTLALGCGVFLGLVAFGANATLSFTVPLKGAQGSQSWTSPPIGDPSYVNLSGWEYDNGVWNGANITYKSSSAAETGEGVSCNQKPTGSECGQHEIGATPWQMIDLNISKLTDWSKLTIYLGSVNGIGDVANGDETGYLLGAGCSVGSNTDPDFSSNPVCTSDQLAIALGNVLDSCTDYGNWPGHSAQCKFDFTPADLADYSDIWIVSSTTDQSCGDDVSHCNNANILLGGDLVLTAVPEPKALGIFGLGLLLIGVFVGLRRRQTG